MLDQVKKKFDYFSFNLVKILIETWQMFINLIIRWTWRLQCGAKWKGNLICYPIPSQKKFYSAGKTRFTKSMKIWETTKILTDKSFLYFCLFVFLVFFKLVP